jgi:putative addiction module component (TIGR02574 family)
VNARALTCPV